MSRTGDIIDKTKRKEPEAKKWKVVAGIVLGLVLAGGMFLGVMLVANQSINYYLEDTKDVLHIYDFYDAKVGENQTAVYFIGSSIVGDAIYTPAINSYLKESGYNITSYNLAMDGDIPLRRTVQIQNIIDSSPSLVIYGVTYRTVTSESWQPERVILVHDNLNIREDSLYLFSDEEIEDFHKVPDLYYKKTYLRNALTYIHTPKIGSWDYFTDPFGLEHREHRDSLKDYGQILNESKNPNDPWRPIVTNESTRYKDALVYNVQTLQNAGIPVVIVNMPLHPLFSEQITDESKQNFTNLLNSTGASGIYDYECYYSDDFFRDSHHAFLRGALEFAPVMADLIIQELN